MEILQREFILTNTFDKHWKELKLDDLDLSKLQNILAKYPELGDVIPGSGGLRKIRIEANGSGKRGGARVCYVDFLLYEKIYLIDVYAKSNKENLTNEEINEYKRFIKAIGEALKERGNAQ